MSTINYSNSSRNSSDRSYSQEQSHSRQSSTRQSSARQSSTRYSSSHSQQGTHRSSTTHHRRRRRRRSPNYGVIAAAGVVLMIVIAASVYGMNRGKRSEVGATTQAETTTEPETELVKEVKVDGITITGMSRDQAKEEILKKYTWGMKVHYQDDTYEVSNLMAEKLDALLEEIYRGEPKEQYTLDTSGLEEAVKAQVANMKERWNKSAKNGAISSYDAASDSFVFEGEATGIAIDEEKLANDIQAALNSKDFDAEISANANVVQPEVPISVAKEKYKTIGTYTTNTTANSKRNTNVRLAAEALNGTIVQPGQELSFNEVVGQRTEAKGYQGAAAYSGGEVVEEIGGGVCQVSTTLYNAVVRAGLKVSVRRSHTFAPSYVTPGQDATVSWGGPEFKFVNTSSTAIGIRAAYSNQTVTVSIYGIPVLEDGITYSLESKKIADIDLPAPTYEEDQTIPPGQEVVKSNGSQGSRWETRLVIKKNGEVISNEVDHTVTYKGHNPVIRRNSSDVMLDANGQVVVPTEATDPAMAQTPAESSAPEPESSAAPTQATQPLGPGVYPIDNGSGSGPGTQPGSAGPGSSGQTGEIQPGLAAPKPEE